MKPSDVYDRMAGNKIRRRRLLALAMTIAYMALLALLSLYPIHPELGERQPAIQIINLLHVPAYAVLCAIWIAYLRLRWRRISDWRVLIPAFVITAVFGAAVELAQNWAPGRIPSPIHMALNLGGALCTVVAILIFPTAEEIGRDTQ
jgi:VanZ family protein